MEIDDIIFEDTGSVTLITFDDRPSVLAMSNKKRNEYVHKHSEHVHNTYLPRGWIIKDYIN